MKAVILFLALRCLVSDPSVKAEMPSLEEPSSVKEVFNALKRAKGILPSEAPQLKIYTFRGSGKFASMHLEEGEIHLDKETYTVCQSMGKDSLNALAFLLGHELGHYIHSHSGINHNIEDAAPRNMMAFSAVNEVLSSSRVNEIAEFELQLEKALNDYRETHDEAQADFEGAVLGYLAGYKTREAGQEFLRRAYARFELTDTTAGYPSLQERLTIVKKTTHDLANLMPLFETSKYLLAVGRYGEASSVLERIILQFESPEIYNNLAIAHTLELLSTFPEPISDYKFPLTFEAEFRAPHPQFFGMTRPNEFGTTTSSIVPIDPCFANEMHRHLNESEDYLQKALLLDNDYALAYLNLSIVQTLKGIFYNHFYYHSPGQFINEIPNCLQLQWDEYERALGNALAGRKYATQQLKGYTLSYHRAPQPGFDDQNVIPPPYFQERFGAPSLKSIEHEGSTFGPSVTMWNTSDGRTPDKAVLLSNIWTQVDVIRILLGRVKNGKLPFVLPESFFSKQDFDPFSRALILHGQNQFAKYNQAVFNQDSAFLAIQDESMIPSECLDKEQSGLIDLDERMAIIENWDFDYQFPANTYYAYFENDLSIDREDVEKIKRINAPTFFHIRVSHQNDSIFYKIISDVNHHNLNQKNQIYFIIPTNVSKTKCGLPKGGPMEKVTELYGRPYQQLTSNQGQITSFQFSVNESTEEGEPNVMNFLDPDLKPITKRTIERSGIIFGTSNNQTISSWALYQTSESSELDIDRL